MTSTHRCTGESITRLIRLTKDSQCFKDLMKGTFEKYCQTGLYIMKCHPLRNMMGNPEKIGSLKRPDGASLNIFSVYMNCTYRRTTQ